jgi:hypothetical protein
MYTIRHIYNLYTAISELSHRNQLNIGFIGMWWSEKNVTFTHKQAKPSTIVG